MFKNVLLAVLFLGLTSCTSKDNLKSLLKDNPDILVEAIEANPDKIIMALNGAAKKAQEVMAKKQQEDEAKSLEESFDKPLEAKIDDSHVIRGPKDAPLTLVIYSDFECPYCSRGFKNESEIAEKYKGKIRVIFKNLPLPMHSHAMIAAQYYEGIALQSHEKAEKYHDAVFSNQQKLQEGESFLKSVAKDLKVDLAKLAKDVNSEAVKNKIKDDMEEGNKFGFQGTPGYLLNGVPVRGAYPTSYFIELVEKLQAKGKVTL